MLTFSFHCLLNINISFLESLAELHWKKEEQIYCTNLPTGINKIISDHYRRLILAEVTFNITHSCHYFSSDLEQIYI